MQRRQDAGFFRITALLVAIAMMAVLVTACSGDDDDGGDTTPGNTATTPGGAGGSPPAAGSPTQPLGDVTVLGIWGAEELDSFNAMVAPFGGNVQFTGTRDITSQLTLQVEGGNPPDVAIPAEVGLFQRFAKEGKLAKLSACPGLEDTIRQDYPEGFIDLGTVDGELYGFFMKADTKATIFYDPSFFEENGYTPLGDGATWDDLVALSDRILQDGKVPPWSMGMEAGAGTGFPGTDWVQQILLNEAGPDAYDAIVNGEKGFDSPEMKDAWEKFGKVALTQGYVLQGGGAAINATNFQQSVYPPFEEPAKAAMVYLGGFASGFITEQFPDAQAGTDFDFMTFPGGAVTGAANIVYAFNSDPTTCAFLTYLASAEAQEIWVKRGGFTSVNRDLPLDDYPSDVARKQAEQLLDADTFRFDLDDAIGGALQQAYFQGLTTYLQDPGSLDGILQNIEGAR